MTIHTGDCIEVMAAMEPDSVDAVVTDPPYGLEFMGKDWDAFKSTGSSSLLHSPKDEGRTFTNASGHMWDNTKALPRYGNGFRRAKNPKDTGRDDVFGRSSQKGPEYQAGNPFQAWCEAWGREALRVTKPGGYLLAFGGTRTHHRLVCGLEDAGWIIRDELDWIYASGFPKGKANLKPAHEPIVLARKPGPLRQLAIDECRIQTTEIGKPREASRREDRENWRIEGGSNGNGATDPAGRWPSNLLLSDSELFDQPNPYVVGSGAVTSSGAGQKQIGQEGFYSGPMGPNTKEYEPDAGGYSRFFRIPNPEEPHEHDWSPLQVSDIEPPYRYCLICLALEWPEAAYPTHFCVPKADRADREPVLRGQLVERDSMKWSGGSEKMAGLAGKYPDGSPRPPQYRENAHPTVKPTDLMRHLVRLVTPTGGTVLDCFLGSGSTAIAAELEGFAWIGIEKEPEYVAIAEARLNGTQRGLGLDVPAPTRKHTMPKVDKGGGTRCPHWPEPCRGHGGDGRTWDTHHVMPEDAA